MEITGKIIVACEPRGGVSARTGNSWRTQEFVIETQEQYPRKCIFEVFGEDKLKEFNINVGDVMKVSFDIDAREYNGRWYNSIRAWKAEHLQAGQPQQATVVRTADVNTQQAGGYQRQNRTATAQQAAPAQQQPDDDLPF